MSFVWSSFALPVCDILPQLSQAVARHGIVLLQAPPGAGKSTLVPLALLDQVEGRRKILILEPRRLAARAVATRLAHNLDEPLGETVGLRTRLETRVGSKTRIEVVTEGVLTRMLQADASLEGVAVVVFDEFHERNLQSDLGFVFAREAQQALRPDLKILLMSATLDAETLLRNLPQTPRIESQGRSFEVDVHYAPAADAQRADVPARTQVRAEQHMAKIIDSAMRQHAGDVLAFLPGAAEIHRVQRALASRLDPARAAVTDVLPLYGDLPLAAQDAALGPARAERRKVILATPIAETSLTIEGVRIVVDSGLRRFSKFDPASGMSRLETGTISKASAQQRCGRAGRTAPGVCFRLWSESEQVSLVGHSPPEIHHTDLAPLALELAVWGTRNADELPWLDAPPKAALAQARDLLRELGALDGETVSAHGRAMAASGLHPRLAHMLDYAQRNDCVELAAALAALLSERDILRGAGDARDADVRTRIEALEANSAATMTLDPRAVAQVKRSTEHILRRFGKRMTPGLDSKRCGELLALAYPERIGRRRSRSGQFQLRSGKGAALREGDALANAEFLVAAEVEAAVPAARIRLAAPIELEVIKRVFASRIRAVNRVEWSTQERGVVARSEHRLDALVLSSRDMASKDSSAIERAVMEGIRIEGLGALPWTPQLRQWQARVALLAQAQPEAWPNVSDAALLDSLEQWAPPWLNGLTRAAHFSRLDLSGALHAMLKFEQGRALEREAPTHIEVPSGSRIGINYLGDDAPSLSVRLQEMFGCSTTPVIAYGRIPLVIKLLSPAHRPVQITRDLASFWSRGYHEVKKDLKGRYPKHPWPADPLAAVATRRTTRRRAES